MCVCSCIKLLYQLHCHDIFNYIVSNGGRSPLFIHVCISMCLCVHTDACHWASQNWRTLCNQKPTRILFKRCQVQCVLTSMCLPKRTLIQMYTVCEWVNFHFQLLQTHYHILNYSFVTIIMLLLLLPPPPQTRVTREFELKVTILAKNENNFLKIHGICLICKP